MEQQSPPSVAPISKKAKLTGEADVHHDGPAAGAPVNGTNGHTNGATPSASTTTARTSEGCIALEDRYSAHNYHPLPVVFSRAKGARVWSVEGREYIDCLSAYSAVNQGHCHPRIVAALCEQAQRLTLSSRAFHSDNFGEYAKKVTELLG